MKPFLFASKIRCTDLSLSVVKTAEEVQQELDFLQNKLDCCLVIDGESLQVKSSCQITCFLRSHVLLVVP